jgi:PAS domain S-box-containing protein
MKIISEELSERVLSVDNTRLMSNENQHSGIREEIMDEKRIQSTDLRFDLLFQAFPAPTYIWRYLNDDFVLVDCNDAGRALFHVKYQQSAYRGFSVCELEDSLVADEITHCYQDRSHFTREMLGHRLWSTGEVKDLFINYAFVEPDLVLMSLNDMTIENSTLGLLKRLSSAVEQTADAVFITDRTGIIEYVNPAFEQVTGYPQAEVLGKTPRILKSGDMSSEYYQRLWSSILSGEAFQAQTVNRRRDGTKLIVEQTITPMKNQSGEITHFVSLLKDMTERIHYQEQETEHRMAGRIQKGLFPEKAPKIEGYDIAGAVFPTSNTSGDSFDFIPMLDNTTGIVVGDVCGHGMGPALIMATARAYLRSITRYVSDPRIVLGELHDQIYRDLTIAGFITLFLARLDPRRHLLEYANAGNWPAYILDVQGNVSHELRTGGVPIGVLQVLELRQCDPIPLAPGSIVVLLTDGFPEAHDATNTEFGVGRLLSLIHTHRLAPASEIIQRVRNEVLSFLGEVEQEDDQTIVICKRTE